MVDTQPRLTMENLARLRADHATYASGALQIQTKQGTVTPLNLNFAQRTVAERIEAQKAETGKVRALILKARQEGISTFCASRIYRGTTLWSNRRGLVIASKLEQSRDIFGIYERFDRTVPEGLRPPSRRAQVAREMSWTSDSRLTVETAGDPDAGRGSTIHYLHASELAMWPSAEETWTALMQAVPPDGGEVYVESTARGIGNLFHALWTQAISGDSQWLPIFLPWWIHEEYSIPVSDAERAEIIASADPWERMAQDEGIAWEGTQHKLTPEQLAWRRRLIADNFLGDERMFRQEYPATAREAFVTSGDGFFDWAALETYDLQTKPPLYRGTIITVDGGYKIQRGERGYIRVWENPDPNGHYVMAADTAEGRLSGAADASLTDADAERGGRDFNSADVLKISEMIDGIRTPCLRQVAQIHGRFPPEVFAAQILGLGSLYSCPGAHGERGLRRLPLTGIERNHSSGQTVLRELDVLGHNNIFNHRRMNVRGGKVTVFVGWITDGTTRMPMLDNLAALVRNGSIEIASADTIREMFSFVRAGGKDGEKPEAQEGTHDDRVISLAIACQMLLHHRDDPVGNMPEPEIYDSPTGMGYVPA